MITINSSYKDVSKTIEKNLTRGVAQKLSQIPENSCITVANVINATITPDNGKPAFDMHYLITDEGDIIATSSDFLASVVLDDLADFGDGIMYVTKKYKTNKGFMATTLAIVNCRD